jgi:hypothetical protein
MTCGSARSTSETSLVSLLTSLVHGSEVIYVLAVADPSNSATAGVSLLVTPNPDHYTSYQPDHIYRSGGLILRRASLILIWSTNVRNMPQVREAKMCRSQ